MVRKCKGHPLYWILDNTQLKLQEYLETLTSSLQSIMYILKTAVVRHFFPHFFLESVSELNSIMANAGKKSLAHSPRGLFLDPTLTSVRFPWLL
jgi:hypothetical protein